MGETLTLYENDGKAEFQDVTIRAKLAAASHPYTGFGANWLDFDHDGRLDLFIANGSVRILDALLPHPYPYGQRNQLFHNTGTGFAELRHQTLDAMVEASRGVAFGDLDLDGDIDIVVSNSNGPVRLLRNTANGRSLTVRLGRRRRGLSVEGTRVGLFRKGQPTLWRRSTATGSYLSANDPAVHFGLGAEGKWQRLLIEWPNGARQEVRDVPPHGSLIVRQAP